jgi:hypothetical protein
MEERSHPGKDQTVVLGVRELTDCIHGLQGDHPHTVRGDLWRAIVVNEALLVLVPVGLLINHAVKQGAERSNPGEVSLLQCRRLLWAHCRVTRRGNER